MPGFPHLVLLHELSVLEELTPHSDEGLFILQCFAPMLRHYLELKAHVQPLLVTFLSPTGL